MDIRKIKRIIKSVIKEIILILVLTVSFLAGFYYIAAITNFFVPAP